MRKAAVSAAPPRTVPMRLCRLTSAFPSARKRGKNKMKKTFLCILLAALLAFSFASCGKTDGENTGASTPDASSADGGSSKSEENTTIPANAPDEDVVGIKETFSSLEYAAYLNIFYEKKGDEYADKVYTKEGTFAVLRDEYNGTDRYYVWGYADKTRCCDWQWEFIPADTSSLPAPGSYVKLKGRLVEDKKSLDGYRFTDTTLETVESFTPADGLDLTVMSPTLARVQIANMQGNTDAFGGKNIKVFGRALNGSCIQHPYYDNSWNLDMVLPDGTTAPATGQYLIAEGIFTAENGGSYLKVSKIATF